ncbi:hypothetical protein [Candidatus Ruminimicrobiellum ovillum]|uniref:hypothetical protein n=1 Tax=Candidatus Ruminimicrobiellum ovillum TaxID=1947927 RepID=UPI0035597CB4
MNQEPIEPEIVDEKDMNNLQPDSEKNKKLWSWIWLIASIIYTIIPLDADAAPVIGWLDDLLLLGAATTNFIQQHFFQANIALNKIFKTVKFILIALAILILLILILIITLIVKN